MLRETCISVIGTITPIVDLAVKFAAQSNDNQIQAVFAEDRLVKNSE